MAGSGFGTLFRITTFGESHGAALGVIVDGCPAGLEISEEEIQAELDKRKPGQSRFTTMRQEGDKVEILSGIFEGKTTGTPICMMVRNQDHHSADYGNIADSFRPGHADYCFTEKYGFRDYRGGGRSSGRETIGRVAAGAIAKKLLASLGIQITAYVRSIGPVVAEKTDLSMIEENALRMPDADAAKAAEDYLDGLRSETDSSGALVECRVTGMIPGLGDPVFDKLDALLAGAMMSIGAVKGVEFGDGFAVAAAKGSENNDAFALDENGKPVKVTNHSGGVLGGISDGSDLFMRIAFKPTPSIAQPQKTVKKNPDGTYEEEEMVIHGRHDPIIAPRAVPVVEAMAALVLADAVLKNLSSKMDGIKIFYGK